MAAAGGANVRDASLVNVLFLQYGGVHGTIIGGPTVATAGGFTGNWWQINWDSQPPIQGSVHGYSAESVIALAPSAGDVSQPSFSSSYYTTANIFWQSGFAPASTAPPNPQLGTALGNCTWYASGRMLELGYSAVQVNALHGNASDWASEALASGISVDSTPTIHSIAQSVSIDHVAVVESVNADGTITVSESSYVLSTSSVWNFLWHHRTCDPTWFSNFIHLSSGGGNLPAPVLSNPANGSTGQSTMPAFTWSAVTGANAGYRIMVATSAADLPTDPTASTGGASVIINATPTTASYTPTTPLNPGTTYYWEVHGRSSTVYGTWSGKNSFTTATTPTRIISLGGSLAFGSVTVNSSAQSTLTIYNTGNSTMTVSSISYPSGFSGNWSGTITAGNSQSVTVTFTPTSATSYGGTVTVNSDATSGVNTIAASGTGTATPTRIISLGGNLAFGSVTVGSSPQSTLTIYNTGNSTMTVSSISYPSGFSGNWSGTIATGGSQPVTVTFSPTSATSYGGTVTVNSDATSGVNTIAASGTGTAAPTRIISLGGNLAFGNVTVNSSAQSTLTIYNTGNSTMTVSSISYPSGFSGNWSGTIVAGGSQPVTVTFSPTSATSYGGTITVNSDKTSGVNTIAASGTGLPNNISVTVQPNPSGCSFTVDGTAYTTAQTFSWVSGSSHPIAATSPQSGGTGIQYVWGSWSDGGAMSHTVAPTVGTTYTANFNTQYYLTLSMGTGWSSYSPASGWESSGAVVPISATAASGYSFGGWSGSGSGQYSGSSSSTSVTMNGPITETASFTDIQIPTNAITSPTAGQRWSNSVFTVTGTARDNVQVTDVSYQLNGAGWNPGNTANGWSNWTASVNLTPGTNIVQAYSVDATGNKSTTNSVRFDFVVTNQLQIHVTGLGTISPNYSNAWLEIGRNYSITSTPASGFVATNWVISINWLGGVTTNSKTVQFMMQSNLTLQANFLDVTRPTNTITAPTAGQHMTNALATVVGTARDNWKVAGVWYQLNNGAWNLVTTTTNNYTNWTQTVTLVAGTNTLKAYAVDLGGNYSTTNSLSVVSSNTFMLQLAFTNALPLKTNGLVFSLQLSKGLNGHIQVSTNLTSWTTLTNFVGTNTTLNFRDPAATNSSRRFYRAVIP
jgi:surface antigen